MAHVLVVDDSWVARLGMGRLLATLDCRVTEAENGVAALDLLSKETFDLVFLDLLMPDLDGFGVLETLQSQGSTVPIFVLSADIQQTTLDRCRGLGARDCLPKPPSKEAVMACLRVGK